MGRLRQIKTHKQYSGEASPYREWLAEKVQLNLKVPEPTPEPAEANPDMLSEECSLWYQDKAVLDDPRLEKIKKEWSKLSVKQRQILHLVGYEGRTFENAAVILGVSKGTIQKTVERIRKRIENEI